MVWKCPVARVIQKTNWPVKTVLPSSTQEDSMGFNGAFRWKLDWWEENPIELVRVSAFIKITPRKSIQLIINVICAHKNIWWAHGFSPFCCHAFTLLSPLPSLLSLSLSLSWSLHLSLWQSHPSPYYGGCLHLRSGLWTTLQEWSYAGVQWLVLVIIFLSKTLISFMYLFIVLNWGLHVLSVIDLGFFFYLCGHGQWLLPSEAFGLCHSSGSILRMILLKASTLRRMVCRYKADSIHSFVVMCNLRITWKNPIFLKIMMMMLLVVKLQSQIALPGLHGTMPLYILCLCLQLWIWFYPWCL